MRGGGVLHDGAASGTLSRKEIDMITNRRQFLGVESRTSAERYDG